MYLEELCGFQAHGTLGTQRTDNTKASFEISNDIQNKQSLLKKKKMNSSPISEVLTFVQSMNEDDILLISEDVKPQTGKIIYRHLILS